MLLLTSMKSDLHINIDHIATLRNARQTVEPNLIDAIKILEGTKAMGITTHLREDRRHINDNDIKDVDEYLKTSRLGFTFEMGATEEIRDILLSTSAKLATLVPEKREELTTEGGLDVVAQKDDLKEYCKPIFDKGIKVSLFLDADQKQIEAAKEVGAQFIEIHTGHYANLFIKYHEDLAALGAFYDEDIEPLQYEYLASPLKKEVERIKQAVEFAHSLKIKTNLGHGLTVPNLPALLMELEGIQELHIGHSVVANSIYYSLKEIVSLYEKAVLHSEKPLIAL